MGRSIFDVFLYAEKRYEYGIPVTFPLTHYQLLDAMERLRIQEGKKLCCEVLSFGDFETLSAIVAEQPDPSKLNSLAQRLSQLDDTGRIAFEGLIAKDIMKEAGPYSLDRLICLAYNTDHCDVYPGVNDYTELGRHYVANGLYPPVKDLPEVLLPMLDYEIIGERQSRAEGGVLTPKGYVIPTSGLEDTPRTAPTSPDYTILLGIFLEEHQTQLKLPAESFEMDKALERIGATDWSNVELCCLDCAAPILIPYIGTGDNVDHVNQLAQQLKQLEPQMLKKYKAVLDATETCSVLGASHIAYHLNDYLFSPQYVVPDDMAKDFLSNSMGEIAMKALLPYINLCGYGESLMRQQECAMTEYGLVSREDGQCLKTSLTPTSRPERGGMTMQ